MDDTANEIVLANLKHCNVVARTIWRRIGNRIPYDDLVQYGRIGLMKAAQTFDPSRGVKFHTFAEWKIRGAILDGIRSETHKGLKQIPDVLSLSMPIPTQPKALDFRDHLEPYLDVRKLQRRLPTPSKECFSRDQEVLRLLAIEGHCVADVATLMKATQSWVYLARNRAVAALRKVAAVPLGDHATSLEPS